MMEGNILVKKKSENLEIFFHWGFRLKVFHEWFQDCAAVWMRSSLFWGVTQRRFVFSYGRFGTTYLFLFEGQAVLLGTGESKTEDLKQFEASIPWNSRSQWPRGLRPLIYWDRGFESHRRHGCLSVVSVMCCLGSGLCDRLIARPEESYRLLCVVMCVPETSWMRRPWPTGGLSRQKQTFLEKKSSVYDCTVEDVE